MINNYWAPTLAELILHHLTLWHTDTHTNTCSVLRTDDVDLVRQHQNFLEWDAFLKGFLSPLCAQIQNNHFLELKSRKTGTQWCGQLIKKIWELNHFMWTNRNEVLHHNRTIIYQLKSTAINNALLQESIHGPQGLPFHYHPLFKGGIRRLIKMEISRENTAARLGVVCLQSNQGTFKFRTITMRPFSCSLHYQVGRTKETPL